MVRFHRRHRVNETSTWYQVPGAWKNQNTGRRTPEKSKICLNAEYAEGRSGKKLCHCEADFRAEAISKPGIASPGWRFAMTRLRCQLSAYNRTHLRSEI